MPLARLDRVLRLEVMVKVCLSFANSLKAMLLYSNCATKATKREVVAHRKTVLWIVNYAPARSFAIETRREIIN